MGRPRRRIFSNRVYEICIRTRRGLPFAQKRFIRELLSSVMARVQRDHKVVATHYLWMANHLHILVVAKDKTACTEFYGQLQKQLTEAVKRLLGLTDLSLWKSNSASVVELVDEETICFRIAYFYANPASANLVGRIEKYPGLSSWSEFKRNLNAIDAASTTTHAWIRLPMIEKLRSLNVSSAEDHDICAKWRQDATEYHDFTIYPNAWMKSFYIEGTEQVRATNKKILLYVRLLQKKATAKRIAENKTIMHPTVLAQQPIDMTYIAKKPSRRIVTYSLEPKLLTYLLEQYEIFCEECAKCYESWKHGDFSVEWPEGALKPPFPNTQNDFGDPIQVPD